MTNLIGFHGDDGAQGEDKRVNIFHVQVVSGHGVRHGVSGQSLKKKKKDQCWYCSLM